ncbi:Di-copper centre-containing protein [Penicillium robsamsonii]|uniref:Di-copper centre-containing protein n=1 Tax=Penicillium robsamsonii TaxID=1792511 RepID=UPI0025479C6C|nr:Di-copper centre-containing protein [Penicillium robsamsonii]KAJ5812716.1 Di-copper centre-containing protein [Penicillium robsamsonii]
MVFIVKGIDTHDTNGDPYLRKDIDKWYADQVKGNRMQLTLFMEALALIQKRSLDDLDSYFRLAAIHSAPWCTWDGVEQPHVDGPDEIRGYCVHNNYTFPTWHRVYLMLYERVLYDAMYEWINKTVPEPNKDTWKKEADEWRLPYWDFARFADRPASTAGALEYDIDHDRLRLPILCMMPNVQITVFPKGKDPTIESRPNPLYKYEAPKPMGEFDDPFKITGEHAKDETNSDHKIEFTYPWDKCIATTKYGILDGFDASIWADGGQNWLRANYALNEHPYYGDKDKGVNAEKVVPTLQDLVYRLFQYPLTSWGAFSTTRYTSTSPNPPVEHKSVDTQSAKLQGDIANAISLEFIHNNIHNFVGGTQFLRPPKEGIHLWGAGHMGSVAMAAFDPIFFIYHNNIDRLTAMWQMLHWEKWFDDDHSKLTRNNELAPFHRTEKEFWKSDDVQDWRKLGYEYEILKGRTHSCEDDQKKIQGNIATLYGNHTKDLFDGLPKQDDRQDDFVITVIYDKYALNGGAYKINLFLEGAKNFRGPESEGFVASIYNFSGSLASGACGNCQQQKADGVKCIAQVPATVPIRYHLKRENKRLDEAPRPMYMVLNSLGNVSRTDPPQLYAAD